MNASEIRDRVGDFITSEVRRGVSTYDEVVAGTVGQLGEAVDGDAVQAVVTDTFAAHLEEQRGWPELLDSDRLQRAFRILELDGIIARADFTCCRSCGAAAIEREIADGGRDARGYVFFHSQDAGAAVRGSGIELSYGSTSHRPERIGQDVVTRLREAGLAVGWCGDPHERIFVDAAWQRRRVGRRAAFPGALERELAPLTVTFCDHTDEQAYEADVPMTLAECRSVWYGLPPEHLSFVSVETTVDGELTALATYWQIEEGRARLWAEVFHPGRHDNVGRYLTLDEVDDVLTAFAVDKRVALGEHGELTHLF